MYDIDHISLLICMILTIFHTISDFIYFSKNYWRMNMQDENKYIVCNVDVWVFPCSVYISPSDLILEFPRVARYYNGSSPNRRNYLHCWNAHIILFCRSWFVVYLIHILVANGPYIKCKLSHWPQQRQPKIVGIWQAGLEKHQLLINARRDIHAGPRVLYSSGYMPGRHAGATAAPRYQPLPAYLTLT